MTPNHVDIAKAFAAVQENMLPGLAVAWDKSGPAVLLAAQYAVAKLAVDSRYRPEDLIEIIRAVEAFET